MYSQNNPTAMAPPQKPETFMLSDAAQQSLPQDAQVALQQVDNRKYSVVVISDSRVADSWAHSLATHAVDVVGTDTS